MLKIFSAHVLAMWALLLCGATQASADSPGFKPGQYESLMLAVTPEHQVEGYYSEEMGQGVTRHCTFYLQGKIDDAASTPITTWLDEAYPGTLAPAADGVTLTVERGREHPGCPSVLMPEIATGLELSQTASKPWIGLVTVSADKAYLLKTAGGKIAKRPYIVKEDVVGVLAYKDGWARVEFIGKDDRSFIGWIRDDQYTRLVAPGS